MVSFGLVGPTELPRASQLEPPPRDFTKLFPPRPVPAPLRPQTAHVRRPSLRAMAETDANLLRHFPLLLPQNREKTVYEGFISAQVPRGVILSRQSLSLAAQPDPRAPRLARVKPDRETARRHCAYAVAVGGVGAGGRAGPLAGPGLRWAVRCAQFPWLSPSRSS